ncbi:DNA polymerase III subunit delta [Patescibacteria group bacterium]|nr:DNA polymerase III subunit delta [Patescibacteria group bacterium]
MLLLLYGPETYLARIRLQELKEQARAQGAFIFNIDCKEANLREVFQELNTPSLFDSKKFLVLRHPFGLSQWGEKEFQDALLKTDPHTLVFMAREEKRTDPLFKFLLKHGKLEEFPKLKGSQLKSWIAGELKKHTVSFAPGVDDLLLFSCGDDLERLSREVAKLAAFRRFSLKKQITKDDVLLLVSQQLEPKIFSTIDAISAKDKKGATKLLQEHLNKGEAPLQLLSMFAWQFRLLLSIKDLEARGVSRQEITRKLKLQAFVAQKSFAATQRFSLEELKELYKKVFSLDLAFKTSKGNPDQLLYLFVASAGAKEKQRP